MTKPVWILSLLIVAFSGVLSASVQAEGIDFGQDIWPIFEEHCISCHGPEKQKHGLRFDDLEWLSDDEMIVPGDPEASLIYELISLPEDQDDVMPPKGEPLTNSQIILIRLWIEGGGKAEGWVVPEIKMDTSAKPTKNATEDKTTSKVSDAIVLAKDVEAAPADAVSALEAQGALAIPLAQDNNLLRVDFNLAGDKITDEQLALLGAVSNHVTWLSLANTKVSDAGLQALAGLPKLTRLHLDNTQIGDAGLAHLTKLAHLEYLNLSTTQVTDDGLKQLASVKTLRKVFVWQSKVTPEGAKALEAAIPGIEVNTGASLNIIKPKIDLSAKFGKDSCCAKAHAEGTVCEHACCVKAAKKNKVCKKCNKRSKPKKKSISALFTDGSCCAKAHADGKVCSHGCCVEAATKDEVCTKCNKSE